MSLIQELKRRNVFRVGLAYVLGAWVLLQIIDFALEVIAAPDWILQVFFLAAAVGLPVVLIFSWVFEMTPEGIKRESEIDRSTSITPQTGRKLDRIIIVFLGVAVITLLADKFMGGDGATTPVEPEPAAVPGVSQPAGQVAPEAEQPGEARKGERSVAVLPFVNMSADPEQEYFSDGISEELLNVLVRIEGLRVPSRTSSFTFKGSNKKVAEIGRELQVDHVLEGSVRKSDNRIRVTAQLIDVATDTHLWSDTYTRELDDVFAVQDEIAQAIVGALKITLSGEEQQSLSDRSTRNVEAYNKYLLGRHLWNTRSRDGLRAAIAPLREAVQLDPQFELAWAALADGYALIPEYQAGPIDENVSLGREAAERALAINPDSARALTALAYLKSLYAFDIDGAIKDYRRALELDPGYATAHQWYGELLAVQRRTDESLEQIRLAAEADPLASIIVQVEGWILMGAGRYEEALEVYRRGRLMDPHMPPMARNMVGTLVMLGNYAEARKLANQVAHLYEGELDITLAGIDALENPELVGRALEKIQAMPDGVMGKAEYLAMLGEYELALDSLERAFEMGDPYAIHMNRLVIFDPLREEPRFRAMLEKMNLL
jgi:TolB-like protein